jgi:hypothetical protein
MSFSNRNKKFPRSPPPRPRDSALGNAQGPTGPSSRSAFTIPQLLRMPLGGHFAREEDFVARKLRSHVQRRQNARDNPAVGVALGGELQPGGKRRVTSEAGDPLLETRTPCRAAPPTNGGHSRTRFFQCHNYVFDNLLVRPARCGFKDRVLSASSTCGVVEADVHREWSEILTLNQNRAVALGTFALAHDAEALGHFSVGLQEAAEVAAEAVLVEFLARLDVPQPA